MKNLLVVLLLSGMLTGMAYSQADTEKQYQSFASVLTKGL